MKGKTRQVRRTVTKAKPEPAPKQNKTGPESDLRIALPTKPVEPPDTLTEYALFLFGEKGIGKTSLCAQIPNLLVTMWEPRRRNLKVRQIPKEGEHRLNWIRFKEYLPMIIEKRIPISVDTIDKCYVSCFEYHCYTAGVKHPNDLNDYGALWYSIKQDFEHTFNELLYNEILVIFVSHCRFRAVPTKTGEEENERVIPTLSDAPWGYIKAVCDLCMFYGYVVDQRAITVRGDETIWAACGIEDHFLDDNGEPLTTFLLGNNSAKQAYQTLQKAFDNHIGKLVV